jgi:hypothetical protein
LPLRLRNPQKDPKFTKLTARLLRGLAPWQAALAEQKMVVEESSQIVHIILVIFITRAADAIFFFLRFPLLSRQLFRSSNLPESVSVSSCLHVDLIC